MIEILGFTVITGESSGQGNRFLTKNINKCFQRELGSSFPETKRFGVQMHDYRLTM